MLFSFYYQRKKKKENIDILEESSTTPLDSKELKNFLEDLHQKISKEGNLVTRQLESLQIKEIENILGISGVAPNRSLFPITGSIKEKIEFIKRNMHQNLIITLTSQYKQNGSFDIRGFDFKLFNPEKKFFLTIKKNKNQYNKIYISDHNNLNIQFPIQEKGLELINMLRNLENLIRKNKKVQEIFEEINNGLNQGLKISFESIAQGVKLYFKDSKNEKRYVSRFPLGV